MVGNNMMEETKQEKKSKKKVPTERKIARIVLAIFVVLGLLFAGAHYMNEYADATDGAKKAAISNEDITVTKTEDYYLFEPADEANLDETKGVIFYPGGKVEERAYAPLMQELAAKGERVYLMRMPFHLAIFDKNAADAVIDANKEVTDWTMMGHSLGGAMAASYAGAHQEEIDSLILLGAYSTSDLTESGIKVLSIYGSEDQVLNHAKYEKNRSNLPKDFTEYVIEGGNHAQYGFYGEQKGDGTATIRAQEQQEQVLDQIRLFEEK